MGYLSGDKNLIQSYQSGDIYINTAKLFGYWDELAPKEKREETRNDPEKLKVHMTEYRSI